MRKIRIVNIVTNPFQLQNFKGQVSYFKNHGFEVFIICSSGEGLEIFCEKEGVEFFTVEIKRKISIISDIIAIFRIKNYLRKKKIDIVSGHTPKGGLLGMIAATLAFVPVKVYTIHGVPFETAKGIKKIILKITERISCFLALNVIAVSSSLRQLIIDNSLCPADKINVIAGGSANGIDYAERFNPSKYSIDYNINLKKILEINQNDRVIGFVGRLANDKGIIELILAWNNIKSKVENIRLLIVGPLDERDGLPQAIIDDIKYQEGIIYLGEVENIEEYYPVIDIFVLPSYREGLPNVLLEASAMELPLISTNATGCIDVIKNGINGLSIEIRNYIDLENKIVYYLEQPQLRKEHGVNGRAIIKEKFAQKVIWDGLISLFKNLHEKVKFGL